MTGIRRWVSALLCALCLMAAGCGAAPSWAETTATPSMENVGSACPWAARVDPLAPPAAATSTHAKRDDYAAYRGNWIHADTAKTRDEVYEQGGSAIQFTRIDGNSIEGNIISVSASPGRRHARVDFSGVVVDGRFDHAFTEDGWGSSGALSVVFEDDRLRVTLVSQIADDNATGWCIGDGEAVFIREG